MRLVSVVIAVLLWPLAGWAKPDAVSACERDADCDLRLEICDGCAPCSRSWRLSATKAQNARTRDARKRARCSGKLCPGCGSSDRGWFGDRFICQAGSCHAALAARPDASSKEVGCKRDSDCAPRPRSGCSCPGCGTRVRDAVNRNHAAWLERQYAAESCAPRECAMCEHLLRWLPSKIVCHQGQCTAIGPH